MLFFLKIGGSVLGDKRRARSFRKAVVRRIGSEIASALEEHPRMRLLLGHGGGPMAHSVAGSFHVRAGLPGGGGWKGYAATRRAVIETNLRVIDALEKGGLQPILASPSAGLTARNGAVRKWDISIIQKLLRSGQIPLIHGDAVLDDHLGFTILSTEELMAFLARELAPKRIIVACDVPGVLDSKGGVIPEISVTSEPEISFALPGAGRRNDVTGGMAAKVRLMAQLARRHGVQSCIVSGLSPGAVASALRGQSAGTRISCA